MGLEILKGTELYSYVRTCIPMESEIITYQVFDNYELHIKPRYMNLFGTMCDYGVRAREPRRCFAYIELGMLMGSVKEDLSYLTEKRYLSAEQAYHLATKKKASRLGDDFICDYAEITERSIAMYRMLRLEKPVFGAYYNAVNPVNSFECDCASDSCIVDMKVSRTCRHNRDYWTQVLLYSLLVRMRDKRCRRRLCLLYPVQGVLKEFTYEDGDYSALYKVFSEKISKGEIDEQYT